MRKQSFASFCLAAGFSMYVLAGCASQPSTADLMRGHAEDLQTKVDLRNQLALEWEKGSKLIQTGEKRVKNGEKLVKSAEEDLKDGENQVETGNKEIAEGKKLMQESELRFRENFPSLPLESPK